MPPSTVRARPWAGPSFGAVVALSVFVLFAPSDGGVSPFPGSDKVVHLVLFALLAGTARWAFGARRGVLALVGAYAVASEVVQGQLLSSRSGDPVDVLADLLGAALGWLVAERLLTRRPA